MLALAQGLTIPSEVSFSLTLAPSAQGANRPRYEYTPKGPLEVFGVSINLFFSSIVRFIPA